MERSNAFMIHILRNIPPATRILTHINSGLFYNRAEIAGTAISIRVS